MIFILAFLLSAAGTAHAQFRSLCRDGLTPRFSGNPFLPADCREAPEPTRQSAPLPSDDSARDSTTKDARLPDALIGRWEGVAIYGSGRHLIALELRRGKHGMLDGSFFVEDYRLHHKHVVRATLDPKIRSGRYAAKVWMDHLPDNPLKAEFRFEPAPAPGREGFARSLTVAYRGQGHAHQALFSLLSKDKLRYVYRDLSRAEISAVGELRRTAE